MRYKNVLFDLDGTLTDPAEGITNALMHAQRRLGRTVSRREDLYVFIGPPLIEMFMSEWGLTREESQQALVYYREHFGTKGLFENVPYPGIGDCLADLKAAGLRLYVATSKPEPLSLRILEHFDLLQHFKAVAGSTMEKHKIFQRLFLAIQTKKLQTNCTKTARLQKEYNVSMTSYFTPGVSNRL